MLFGWLLVSGLSAQINSVILPEENPETPETLRYVWGTDPGIRYLLEESTDLSGWSPVAGFPTEAAALAQQHAFEVAAGETVFYRVTQLDEQAPAIIDRFPDDGDFSIKRFGTISVRLADQTGVDPASVTISVGSLGSFQVSDPELSLSEDVLTFSMGGDTALGVFGETIPVSLIVADTLGYSATYEWSFDLEVEAAVPSNVLVFGSPAAQRMGQDISALPTRELAARFGGGGITRMNTNADPWTLHSVEADRIILAYTGDTAPVIADNTYVSNVTPATRDEIFYRLVISSSDDPVNKLLTLFTEEATVEDMVDEGSITISGDSVLLEFDSSGAVSAVTPLRALSIDETVTFPRLGFSLDGASLKLMENGFEASVPLPGGDTLSLAVPGGAAAGNQMAQIEAQEWHFWLTPQVSTALEVGWTGLKRFKSSVGGNIEAASVLDVSLLLDLNPEPKTLFDLPVNLEPEAWIAVGAIGPVPIFTVIGFDLKCEVEADATAGITLEYGFRQDYDFAYGVDYLRDRSEPLQFIRPAKLPDTELVPFQIQEIFGEVSVGLSLKPQLKLTVYKLAGVSAGPKLTGEVVVEASTESGFTGELRGAVALELSRAGVALEKANPSGSWKASWELWEGPILHLFPQSLPLAVTGQPRDLTVTAGESARFAVNATASDLISYQWYHDGTPLPSQTASELNLASVGLAHAGGYKAMVSAGNQSAFSDTATLAVVTSGGCSFPDDYPHPAADPNTADDWLFFHRECTSYVAWKMNQLAGTTTAPWFFSNYMNGGHFGNASNWADNADAIGYAVSPFPQVGAIAHWDAGEGMGGDGHVAFVEEVNPDGSVNVSEYNVRSALNNYAGHRFNVRCGVSAPRYIHMFTSPNPPPAGFSLIPAGSFQMGDSFGEGGSDELPVHSVYVSAFHIQRTEVTNAQMASVLNWAIGQGLASATTATVRNVEGNQQELLDLNDADCQISWNGSQLVVDTGKEDYPCMEVTWYGSMAYCHYLTRMEGGLTQAVNLTDWSFDINATGYRLPTDAEWEKAARGGLPGKRFPWGDTITHSQANYYSSSSYSYDISPTRGFHPDWDVGGYPHTSPVGTFAANDYDLYDMAGNLYEWCGDWYSSSYYSSSPGTNPTGPSSGTSRVVRGGGWGNYALYCRVSYRNSFYPGGSIHFIGFRPARSE